jgi:AbrB family looped-hinge helix DNA binding protein
VSKVTSKLQVTVPKAIADRYGIRPGDEIEWVAAGDTLRVVPATTKPALDVATRLRLFDAATARQRAREKGRRAEAGSERGWAREELYSRRRSR